MAHRCWELDEIVRIIAAHLVSDEARASAVSLASCSKSLEEPALREVWRNLSSLAPLVKCFPPELWEIEGEKLVFKSAPTRQEWNRFQQRYASKVQCLDVTSPETVISSTALHLLQLYSSHSPLLPNLVSLSWDSREKFLPFVSPFISRSLLSVDIKVPREASSMMPPILMKLSASSPDIREIRVELLFHSPATEEASSQLLMQCNHHRLRKFNVDSPISPAALGHIIQLPSLEKLWLVFNSVQLPNPLPPVVFPSLQLLDVEYTGAHTWLELLRAIENPVLKEISVECPGPDVEQFMEAFQLTIAQCQMQEILQEFSVRSPQEFKISPGIIACTFSFKNLTSLEILSDCEPGICQTFDITDRHIELLTKAMPRLESLTIGGAPCNLHSQITFKSLYTISHRCPRLSTLQIHFNAALFVSGVETGPGSAGATLCLSDLKTPSPELCLVTTIDVGSIPLPNSDTSTIVALGLLGVFPHLKEIEYEEEDWADVQDLIGVCHRMGRFAFGKG